MRLILFDLFDTLLEKVWFDYNKIMNLLLECYFTKSTKEDLLSCAKEYYDKFMFNRNKTHFETSFIDQIRYYEIWLNQKHNQDYFEIEWNIFSLCRKEILAEGAIDTLEYLKERGYTLAVLSNSIFSAITLKRYLQEFGILDYFDKVVSSADIGFRKPSEKAFSYLLNCLEVKANDEIYFIGNNIQKDIIGAKNIGITPILLKKSGEYYDGSYVTSLTEFKEFLESNYIYLNCISERESLVDGPGLRTVVYLQGCKHYCDGCHNKSTWDLTQGERMTVSSLAQHLIEKVSNKKITFSGGEPLLQAKALISLIRRLPDFDVCLYTGCEFEEVPKEVMDIIHYLKVGCYEKELLTTTMPFVGSSNQRFINLR